MENKVRNSNIELLRILCMFFIIMHHSFYHSYLNTNLTGINYYLLYGLQFLGKMSNNIFVLITGYYMVDKQINKKSIKKTIFKTLFYSYMILIIYILITHNIDFNIILSSLVPLSFNNNWFVISYVLLYISIPIINILISNLSQKQYEKTLIILVVILSVFPTIKLLQNAFSTYIWFICLYMIGAYIKKYKFNLKYKKENNILLLISFLFFYIFVTVTNIFKLELGNMGEVNSFIMLIMATSIFVFFINKKEWNNKGINYISSSVLGIYLIHDNFIIRQHMWGFFKIEKYLSYPYFFVYEIGIILFVFCSCLIIDKVLEKFVFKHIVNKYFADKNKQKELIKI